MSIRFQQGFIDSLTLILSITSLNLLMYTFLHFSLQNSCSLRLVIVGYLEDMRSIDPIVLAASHDMVSIDIEFKDGDLQGSDCQSLVAY